MSSTDLRKTVRKLRDALDKSQQEFGQMIGKGLATIQRYETLVPPRGSVLTRLEMLALEHGFDEYASEFRTALAEELGRAVPQILPRLPIPPKVEFDLTPADDDERALLAMTLFIRRNPKCVGDLRALKRIFARWTPQVAEKLEGYRKTLALWTAIGRCMLQGDPPVEIARKFNIPDDILERLLEVYDPRFAVVKTSDSKTVDLLRVLSAVMMGMSLPSVAKAFNLSPASLQALESLRTIRVPVPEARRVSSTLRHPAWEFTDLLPLSFDRVGPAC